MRKKYVKTEAELAHYGILGMKWGVTRTNENRRHLGIDEKGNINLIKGKTTKKAAQKFAIKTGIFVMMLGLASYIKKNPALIGKGMAAVQKVLSTHGTEKISSVSKIVEDSGFYSKALGRMLSIEEAISKGLL